MTYQGDLFFGIFTTLMGIVTFVPIIIWILKLKRPVHFNSLKDPPKPEEITDIPAFNKANAKMWAVYGGTFVLAGFVGLVHLYAGLAILLATSILGIIPLAVLYKKIV
jgi:hypothetical protein